MSNIQFSPVFIDRVENKMLEYKFGLNENLNKKKG